MKAHKTYKNSLIFWLTVTHFFIGYLSFGQQITVNDSFTSQQLIENNLVQGCVEVSNINSNYNGQVDGFESFGYFERANSNFPFENGIILSTGQVTSAGNTTNTSALNEGSDNWSTDPDLEAALGINSTLNATSIEFDFVSTSSTISFNYILASEEYFADYPCQYSDGFAFLIRETGSNNPYQNIALVPGTSTPVNTNTIHDEIVGFCPEENSNYFEGYNIGDTNFNGRTTVMTASANITPNVQYSIKLIVADQTDRNFDTAVFIEGNSFTDSVDLGEDITTCDAFVTLDANTNNPQASYQWYLDGNIINNQTDSTLNVTTDGNYTVEVTVPLSADFCSFQDSINVVLNTIQNGPTISDIEVCDDASNDGTEIFDLTPKTSEIEATLPPSTYDITFHTSQNDATNDQNPTTSVTSTTAVQPIFYNAQDTTSGCIYIGTFNLIINPFPTIVNPSPLSVCSDGGGNVDMTVKDDEITSSNTSYVVSYHFSNADALTGDNPIPQPYTPSNPTETVFVRVVDITTGCFTTTTLDIEVNTNPQINPETVQLDACEQDGDGFDTFDLTQEIDQILQGLTNVTVTYHESQEDANNGTNPIANPTSYDNIDQDVQTVFVRVEDNTTGCASVVPMELHAFLLETGTNITDFYECDDASNDQIVDFDLYHIGLEIINDLENVTIDFYETETDQINNTNAINQSVPYTINASPTLLYITLNSSSCSHFSNIQLLINEGFEVVLTDIQTYCDTDDDGFTSIDLTSFDTYSGNGIPNPSVDYYLTQADADNNTNSLPAFYTNTTNPLTLYVRVQNTMTGCYATSSLDIEVLPAPTINQPSDIIICDDDQDGFFIVDLDDKIPEIVNTTTDRAFSFHTSLTDAETNSSPITDTQNYNANTQTVYCRVENTNTGCYAVQSITIIVNTLPIFTPIETYTNCENDGNQTADFIFQEKDAEILNGQSGKEVLYFETAQNAINNVAPIDKTVAYQNTSSPQTIFVRVHNITDQSCYDTTSFDIEVGAYPIYNTPTDIFVCDDNSNDGSETFNLDDITSEITQGSLENLTVTYHLSLAEAEAQTNPLPNSFTNTVNPQQIFAVVDNGTYCKGISSFEFNVIQVPLTNTPNSLETCDNDTDGFTTFDLTVSEIEVLPIRQNNTEIEYYTNLTDLVQGTNQITNPENFTNTINPQTVFIKVVNTISNCYAEIPLDLIVEVPPVINPNVTTQICEESTFSYNLNNTLPDLVDTTQAIETEFYSSLNDAQLQQNTLDSNYNYNVGNQTIFVRANFTGSNCFNIESFTLRVNPLPTANNIQDLETCDDDYDLFANFDLSEQTPVVLGNQNSSNFTVNYYTSQLDANNNENALTDLNVFSEDGTTYFIRIENNTTGCYKTTSFNTIVHRKPELDIENQVLCLDNLPLLVSAETNAPTDSYLWSNGSTNSYIEINQTGTYSVTITTQFGCSTSTSFSVSQSEAATIDFTETIDFSDPNNVTVEVSGIGDYLYQFDDEDPQESNFFNNVPIGPHTITVIDLNGCNSTSKDIVIIDVPKFVTPNNDGYFDTWHITGVEQLEGTIVHIFDRYGKLLKTLNHTSQGWDGTYNGNLLPATDYWYVANVKKGAIEFEIKGHFALKL